MELAKIEGLLEAYFEGNTTLSDERELGAYFTGKEVAPHLEAYASMFAGFGIAKEEVSTRDFEIPKKPSKNYKGWWYSFAASFVIAICVAGFMYSEKSYSQEEKAALAAFQQSKEAMLLLSKNLNEGTEKIALVNQFTETKNRILK